MDVLTAALLRHTPRPPAWLLEAIAGAPPPASELAVAFGGAPYAIGKVAVVLDPHEADAARAAGAPWMAGGCTASELARVVLVRAVAAAAHDPLTAVRKLFTSGDSDERAAVLRALPLLPEPASFASLATEGCRTNVKTVFEAIACENCFPARHLSEAAFCQMVLKAVFLGTPVARIEGLAGRVTDELRRMARGYASERLAAGRTVPDDIHTLLGSEMHGASA
jgi:hypothetical protein